MLAGSTLCPSLFSLLCLACGCDAWRPNSHLVSRGVGTAMCSLEGRSAEERGSGAGVSAGGCCCLCASHCVRKRNPCWLSLRGPVSDTKATLMDTMTKGSLCTRCSSLGTSSWAGPIPHEAQAPGSVPGKQQGLMLLRWISTGCNQPQLDMPAGVPLRGALLCCMHPMVLEGGWPALGCKVQKQRVSL